MNVFLDVSSVRHPLTGIGRYALELARHLPAVDPTLKLKLIAGSRRVLELTLEPSDAAGPTSQLTGRMLELAKRFASESGALAKLYQQIICFRQSRLLHNESGLFHSPQFRLPDLKMPGIVTIHDLSVYSWAQCHPPARVAAVRKATEHAITHASHIITDSEFARQEIMQHFDLDENFISATPLGCSAEFRPRDANEVSSVLKAYGLNHDGYAFFSGTIEPRKNIASLLDAYERLPVGLRQTFPLVLCGFRGWKNEGLHARIALAHNEGWLKYLGYVEETELLQLFSAARVFVFPSLYEGFGLPILEAMASGTPVVCSNSASLPEVAGEAAAMCDALDVDALSELVRQALEDPAWRAQARMKGLEQSARFSWQRCAAETVRVYRTAYGRE